MTYISSFERFGIEKGLKQGREEGRQEGERKLLLKQLKLKFRIVPQHYQALLKQAGEKELLHLSEGVLTAATLKELFADLE